MLINALCNYYDILADAGKVLPPGYSNVKVHYAISLTEDGRIDDIIQHQRTEQVPAGKGKTKERKVPAEMKMPQRTEKTGICANIVDHRPLYIFGLNQEKEILTAEDRTNKAQKSHGDFTEKNLRFIEGLDSPVINAFRNFLIRWNPKEETENSLLLGLGKDYGKSGFAFCFNGDINHLLHDEPQIKEKWEEYKESLEGTDPEHVAQCAVTGQKSEIARIHSKIKGVYGGLATGSVLVGFNNPSENSYGNEQSYNSNISKETMKKYTEALNYLLGSSKHKVIVDDMTVVFWAMEQQEKCEDLFKFVMVGKTEQKADETEEILETLVTKSRQGKLTESSLQPDSIEENIDFYMVGLKPNTSRLSVKFIFRKKFADILWNVAEFQKDMQVTKEVKPISLLTIKKAILSSKIDKDKLSPAFFTRTLETMVYGGRCPEELLKATVQRVKVEQGNVNAVRAGIIKACLNRNYLKEALKVTLDKENRRPAYLCGRLFAVLERLQQAASDYALNRTIKDAYFVSASVKPAAVFQKLMHMSVYHMKKTDYPGYFDALIGEITSQLEGGFPGNLNAKEQGEFIVGYYQQRESFFEKKEREEKSNDTGK